MLCGPRAHQHQFRGFEYDRSCAHTRREFLRHNNNRLLLVAESAQERQPAKFLDENRRAV